MKIEAKPNVNKEFKDFIAEIIKPWKIKTFQPLVSGFKRDDVTKYLRYHIQDAVETVCSKILFIELARTEFKTKDGVKIPIQYMDEPDPIETGNDILLSLTNGERYVIRFRHIKGRLKCVIEKSRPYFAKDNHYQETLPT